MPDGPPGGLPLTRAVQPFAEQWEFVRFAEERQLGLDLTSPPQRPEPVAAGR